MKWVLVYYWIGTTIPAASVQHEVISPNWKMSQESLCIHIRDANADRAKELGALGVCESRGP
jgi:hypothetical protein